MSVSEKTYLFVGENPSNTAIKNGWTWEDGRLAAKQLFDALREAGIDPNDQMFLNIFLADGKTVDIDSVELILAGLMEGVEVVSMGQKVQTVLQNEQITNTRIVHPAARGSIRKKENYIAHIKETLITKQTS